MEKNAGVESCVCGMHAAYFYVEHWKNAVVTKKETALELSILAFWKILCAPKYTLRLFVYEKNIFDLQFSEKHSWLVD